MALFDHRVFSAGTEWWVAQVHSASGSGWGDAPLTVTRETVYFSSLTDRERHTVVASIPPGWLHKLPHSSLVRLIARGVDLGTHFKMAAYNAPSAEELGEPACTDDEGLRWALRSGEVVIANADGTTTWTPSAEFICFDDSALRGDVPLVGFTFDEFRKVSDKRRLAEIAEQVKKRFHLQLPGDFDESIEEHQR
jgi:hypothetical protein